MKVAYLDTIAGIAGDMTMAAFVSAGVSLDELVEELRKLPLTGFEVSGRHVQRSAIDAVHIEVVVSHEPKYRRHLKDISAIIEESNLPPRVIERAKAIFTVMAHAEAKIHATTVEKIHFHEVGALDSIVDIVGTAICLEKLDIERVYSSPVKMGHGGFVKTQHGVMPTPTPATLEILRDYPTVLTAIPEELTTPTGAGIVKALSSGMLNTEVLRIEKVGYGAGSAEIAEIPNLLRVMVGELEPGSEMDDVVIVETNIDDMNPQVYPFIIEKLLASGAHDAYLIPLIMKKGRPGVLLSVLVSRAKLDLILNLVYLHTSTIGVRIQPVGRRKLPRRHMEVETSFGRIKAKAVMRDGKETLAAEFDECRRIADERNLSILEVMRRIDAELMSRMTLS